MNVYLTHNRLLFWSLVFVTITYCFVFSSPKRRKIQPDLNLGKFQFEIDPIYFKARWEGKKRSLQNLGVGKYPGNYIKVLFLIDFLQVLQ